MIVGSCWSAAYLYLSSVHFSEVTGADKVPSGRLFPEMTILRALPLAYPEDFSWFVRCASRAVNSFSGVRKEFLLLSFTLVQFVSPQLLVC